MSSYTEDIKIAFTRLSKKGYLLESITYRVGGEESREKIIVPAGFEWDGATIPRLFWVLGHPRESKVIMASLVHDYLYKNNGGYTRKRADEIFYEALIVAGIKEWRANIYYYGVRVFGWAYRNKIL